MYRIVKVEGGSLTKPRFKAQKKGWFFWHDLKYCSHSSAAATGPHFSIIWEDCEEDIRSVIALDQRKDQRQKRTIITV